MRALGIALAIALSCVASARAQAPAGEAAPGGAGATTVDPAQAEAQALFRRGVELGEQDRWAEALEHFRRSREIAARPNTVFNIAFANHRLGRFREAIPAFDEYLAMTEGEVSERRDEAVRLRGEAVASLAEIRLAVDPADARLLVDGEVQDATGPERAIVLDPGRHVLRATAEGYDEGTLTISVLAGERGERRMTLVRHEVHDETPPPRGTSIFEEPLFWIVAGAIVVVGAGVGIGAGVAASSGGGNEYRGSSGVVLEALSF